MYLGGDALARRPPLCFVHIGQVDLGKQAGWFDGGVPLPPAGTDRLEPHPQRVVMCQHGRQRGAQRRRVHVLGQLQHQRLVELVERAGMRLQVPVLDRGERGGAGHRTLVDLDTVQFGHCRCQRSDRLVPEHVFGAQVQAGRPGPGDDLDGQDRVAAEFEEVVLDPDLRDAEHLGPHLCQRLLDRGPRGHPGTPPGRGPVRRRQRAPVQLSVRVQRQRRQHNQRGRHHVVGQRAAEGRAQRRRVRRRTGRRHQVSDESLVTGALLADHGHRLGHVVVPQQRAFHLAELYPETADLDLVVGPAEVTDLAVGGPPHHVAGAVHPGAWPGERIGDEAFGGQRRPVQVAAGQPAAADVELAGDAGRHRAQRLVQHVGTSVRDRPADRWRLPVVRVAGVPGGGVDGGLGRPVDVGDPATRQRRADVPDQLRRQCLPGQHHRVRPDTHRTLREHLRERRRHRADQADRPVGRRALGQRQRVPNHLDAAAHGERAEDLEHRDVEVERGGRDHCGQSTRAEVGGGPSGQVDHALVRDHDTLRPAGGPGRVDDVRRMGRGQRRQPVGVGHVAGWNPGQCCARPVLIENQAWHLQCLRETVGRTGGGQQQHWPGVCEHQLDALGRVGQVDRQVAGPGLQHREQRHDQLG